MRRCVRWTFRRPSPVPARSRSRSGRAACAAPISTSWRGRFRPGCRSCPVTRPPGACRRSAAAWSGLAIGDAVGVGWIASTCGVCAFCRSGRENLCPRATFTGRDRDGGYAGRMVASARWAYALPAGLAAREAAPLLCAGIIGYRSLLLSQIAPGGRLGLFGFGASAHLAIQVALHWKCEVFAFTREAHHRDLARRMGAVWAGEAFEDPGVELDSAVTFAPAGELVPLALSRLARGGTVAVNAIHMSPIPSFDYEALYGERVVRSVMNYTRRDADEFLALAAGIPVRARPRSMRSTKRTPRCCA